MKSTVQEVVSARPDKAAYLRWGAQRIDPKLFETLLKYAAHRRPDEINYAWGVDLKTAQYINEDHNVNIVLSGEYIPARQKGSRIGSYMGYDMHVIDGGGPDDYFLVMIIMNDDNEVVDTIATELRDIIAQANVIPTVDRSNAHLFEQPE